jgi:energy-coupling factor transporter ATP-binding protein EcfA2
MAERLVGVEIRDVLGITEFEVRPGMITMVEGPNGAGKSSVLTAIQTVLGGGTSLAKLQRVAAAPTSADEEPEEIEPEVVLLIEDETGATKRVRQDADGVDVRAQVPGTKGYKEVPSPRAVLKALWDGQGANPVAFASEHTPEKDRTKMLLESLDLPAFDLDAFKAEVRLPASVKLPSYLPSNPLEATGFLRETVYMTRRGTNVDAKAKTSAAHETRLKVPAAWEDDMAEPAEIAAAEASVTALVRSIGADEARAVADRAAALRAAEDAYAVIEKGASDSLRAATSDLMAQFERDVAKLRRDYDAAVAGLKEADAVHLAEAAQRRDATIAEVHAANETAQAAIRSQRDELAEARAKVAAYQSAAREGAAYRALSAQAQDFDVEAERLEEESKVLTACLDQIDAYRARRAELIPIKGLEIRDGVVCIERGGVVLPVSSMSHGERLMVGLDVAALRVKGLPLILVDEAESLDEEHLKILFDGIRAKGLQVILGRVSNGKRLKTWSER